MARWDQEELGAPWARVARAAAADLQPPAAGQQGAQGEPQAVAELEAPLAEPEMAAEPEALRVEPRTEAALPAGRN